MRPIRRLEAAAVAVLMAAAVVITPAAPLFAGTEDTVDIAFIHDLHSYLDGYYEKSDDKTQEVRREQHPAAFKVAPIYVVAEVVAALQQVVGRIYVDTLHSLQYLGLDDLVKCKGVNVTAVYQCGVLCVLVYADADVLHYLVDLKYHGEKSYAVVNTNSTPHSSQAALNAVWVRRLVAV